MTRTRSVGAHYTQVSKWLGHESYVTTLTIYAGPRRRASTQMRELRERDV
jgi:integrase